MSTGIVLLLHASLISGFLEDKWILISASAFSWLQDMWVEVYEANPVYEVYEAKPHTHMG